MLFQSYVENRCSPAEHCENGEQEGNVFTLILKAGLHLQIKFYNCNSKQLFKQVDVKHQVIPIKLNVKRFSILFFLNGTFCNSI